MHKKLLQTIGFAAIVLLFTPSAFAAFCGDGATNTEMGEQCDDGNFINYDGCSSYCQVEDLDPPEIVSLSIPNGSTGMPTTTDSITITFSEPIDEATLVKNNLFIEKNANTLDYDLSLDSTGRKVTMTINEELQGDSRYAIHIRNIKDDYFATMTEEFISVFDTGEYIDQKPPTVVARPSGGDYHVSQLVELKAYIDEYTGSDEFLDTTAKVYYTLDGSIPTESSPEYKEPFIVNQNTTLKYIGVDALGNASPVGVENYVFSCTPLESVKEREPYPSCKVLSCGVGFVLRNNVCVSSYGSGTTIEDEAVTAPLFSSDTPMMVSSKPAIRITEEHGGTIRRPLIFKDNKTDMTLTFERGTKIREIDGTDFKGLIQPPERLFSKDFPVHYGYVFKSILKFDPSTKGKLTFLPNYELQIPYGDHYNPDKVVTVFTFDEETDRFKVYNPKLFTVDIENKLVTIKAQTSNTFFLAQSSGGALSSEFNDMEGHWARNYAEALYKRGIVKGKAKGKYVPDDYLTRAEFTKIAINAIGAEVKDNDQIEESLFRDVSLYAWYTPYVNKAKEIGLINGYPDGNFRPERQINRAEAIHILVKAFDLDLSEAQEEDIKTRFYKDIEQDQWYFPAMNFVIKNDFLDGLRKEDDSGFLPDWYGPSEPITRGAMAKLAEKVISYYEDLQSQ